ncbi:IS30 family transposase, partial [Rhodococcus sp. BP-266]|nr:IS30 family transposase [Rhodococcus sp. BP-266]
MGRPVYTHEVRMLFWVLLGWGSTVKEAAEVIGMAEMTGHRWVQDRGGVRPRATPLPSGRFLSLT